MHSAIIPPGVPLPATTWRLCRHQSRANAHSHRVGLRYQNAGAVSRGISWKRCNASSVQFVTTYYFNSLHLPRYWSWRKIAIPSRTWGSFERGQTSRTLHGKGYLLKMRMRKICTAPRRICTTLSRGIPSVVLYNCPAHVQFLVSQL